MAAPLKTIIAEYMFAYNTKILRDAIDAAVTYCIEHDVLKTFLLKHRAEVKDVCITEYDEKTFVDGIRAEGRAEERINAVRDMIEFGLPKEKILEKYSAEEYEKAEQGLLVNT